MEYNRCYAAVDLAAIEHNTDEIRKRIGRDTALIAIVKADAYGHGACRVAAHIEKKADAFGVATAEEGIELREAGIGKPILILGYTSPCQYADLILNNITPSVWDYGDAKILSEVAARMNVTAKLHVPIDTGMSRIGFPAVEQAVENIRKIHALPNLFIEGMFSHLACADMREDPLSAEQFREFDAVDDALLSAGIHIPVKHICNSAGISRYDSEHRNAVRAGIILYGLEPSEEVGTGGLDLKPALTWKTHVVRVENIPKGRGVSYGAAFVTEHEVTRIATLSVGYADGYPRTLSNRGRVLIRGQYAPILGRVCMDLMMVDVTLIPGTLVEDEVILIGRDGENSITAEKLGRDAMSFNYETVCRIGKRVKRIYI